MKTLEELREAADKAKAKAQRLEKATTISNAIDFFADIECPHCHELLILPSLENIQNWLEENGQ